VAVHEARNGMPPWIGSVVWFTPDDAKTGNFVPFYAGNTAIPKAYEIGNRAEFDRSSAWWAFDFVGNWAQLRFNGMIQDIKAKRAELEGKFLADQASIEQQALDLYKKDPNAARKFVNDYSNKVAQKTIDEWWKLADFLIVKYNDNGVNVRGGQNPPPPAKEWLDSIGYGTKKIPTKPTGPPRETAAPVATEALRKARRCVRVTSTPRAAALSVPSVSRLSGRGSQAKATNDTASSGSDAAMGA
jgi:hypothetical protein